MMLKCWDKAQDHRPSFSLLVETISSQLSSMTDYMPMKDEREGQAANDGDKEPFVESSM